MPIWVEAILVVLAGLSMIAAATIRANHAGRGWKVEPLGQGQLRGEPDEIAVVYHEDGKQLWFGGTRGAKGSKDTLEVPSREGWDAAVEPWARGRRAEILERLRSDRYVRDRVEFVEARA